MTYQVLARKWRPKNFGEVVGQEHVLRALINALEQQRLHHAYLFTGTRGVGKTTIARILAKCFNCESSITANPCGKCDACNEIDTGKFIDLIEVDAASRTKVEDTRDLLDNVQYLPAKGRIKVYLIDEVHMLSGHSFNALLKTLEEPPAHVKFLLATTDPQKLPVTVLSRCLQFNLKALNPELIQKQLQTILEKENVVFEAPALHQLALAANGSVRDALSLLDQAVAFGNGKIALTDVNSMLGTIDKGKIFKLVEDLTTSNAAAILQTVSDLAELAVDFAGALEELLQIFHQISLLQVVPNLDTSCWSAADKIAALAKLFSPEEVQLYYQICLHGKRDLPLAPSPRGGFEMLMLRLLAFKPSATQVVSTVPGAAPIKATMQQIPTAKPIARQQQSLQDETNILQKIKVTGPTQALLHHCTLTKIDDTHVELLLDPSQAPLLNKRHEERLTQAFSDYLQKPVNVTITIGQANMQTPANLLKQEENKKHSLAKQSIENDSAVKEILEKFDAKIVEVG
jgi:DNA polymerase III subunit gamma/tau